MQYRSRSWFAPVRVECNAIDSHSNLIQSLEASPAASLQSTGGQTCTFEKNIDYGTSDMKSVKASSKEMCCAKCRADRHCVAGIFTPRNSQCWFKTAEDLKHKTKARAGIPTVACMPNGYVPASPTSNCRFQNNTDFAGDGETGVPSDSPADCCRKCQANTRCAAATWVPQSCWIKFSARRPVSLPASRNATACITNKKPKPVQQTLVCTAANDGSLSWSGKVSLAVAPLTARPGSKPDWTKTIDVGPVPPGEARRIWTEIDDNISAACPPSQGPCWLYGQQHQKKRWQHQATGGFNVASDSLRADIGVPLQSLKSLVDSVALPKTKVRVSVGTTNSTTAELTVTASDAAAALYVYLTSASYGQFSENGFHLLAGEARVIGFDAWEEHGALDMNAFAKSLRVQWLNV